MPQKNQSKSSSGTKLEAGPPQTELRSSQSAGDDTHEVEKDQGDLQIIKSPSDPNQYR